jgi:DNA-directed RNA polymerase alpha subunit
MYKSDKQMMKVRNFLTEKEERVKEKLQGRDWMSKAKRRERVKKRA